VEHPAELQVADRAIELGHVGGDRRERLLVGLGSSQFEKLRAVPEPLAEARQRSDDLIELLFLSSEILRALRLAPDARIFQLFRYRGESLRLGVEVKDTSADRQRAAATRRASRRAD